MSQFSVGQKVQLTKPPHIFEGVIIMPGAPAEIKDLNPDGTFNLLYHDREMMPHTMLHMKETEIKPIEIRESVQP